VLLGDGDGWVKRCMECGVEGPGPGERLSERTVELVDWAKLLWIVVDGGRWWGIPMIRMGVSG